MGNESVIDVMLLPGIERLSEVVVTALGISKEKRSLGYAVDEISAEELNSTGESSMILNMAGKAPGVQIQGSGNGLDGSPRVLIRGVTSLSATISPCMSLTGCHYRVTGHSEKHFYFSIGSG